MTPAAIARLFLYLGAMIAVGEASLSLGRRAPGASDRNDAAQTRALALVGWTMLVLASLALLILQARDMEIDLTSGDVKMLLSTTWGRGWSVLFVSSFVGANVARIELPRRSLVIPALCVAIAMGGLGHAAADDAYPLVARLTDAVHVLAVGAWMGGLTLLAWMRWRTPSARAHDDLRDAPRDAPRDDVAGGMRERWESFSRLATIAAPTVVLTGVLAGWRRLQLAPLGQGSAAPVSFATAATSAYGTLLGAKVALVLVMLALGYTHRRRVLREHAPSWTTVCTELGLALVVFAVTAVLTGTAPPGE